MANGGGRTLRPYESLFDGLRQVYSSRLLFPQAAVGIVGQALLLYRIVKNKASEQFRDVAHRTHSFAAGRVGPHKIFHQFYHAVPVKSMRFAAGRAAFL